MAINCGRLAIICQRPAINWGDLAINCHRFGIDSCRRAMNPVLLDNLCHRRAKIGGAMVNHSVPAAMDCQSLATDSTRRRMGSGRGRGQAAAGRARHSVRADGLERKRSGLPRTAGRGLPALPAHRARGIQRPANAERLGVRQSSGAFGADDRRKNLGRFWCGRKRRLKIAHGFNRGLPVPTESSPERDERKRRPSHPGLWASARPESQR